jgi:antitoxin CptB
MPQAANMDGIEFNRLRWNCRRGLLENDLVLEKFLEQHAPSLEGDRLAAFKTLLELDDNSLWALLSGREEWTSDSGPALTEILALLRAC